MQRTSPANIVGWIVMIAILLFAALQASQMLGFAALTALIGQFIVTVWNILFGLIIFGVGLWLSTVVYRMIRGTGATNAEILATAARIAIAVFAGALALRQMGIAESIVNLAFGLLLGALAVAAAIAFDIGGREEARRLLEQWRGQISAQAAQPPSNPPIPTTGGMSGRTGFDQSSEFDQNTGFNQNRGMNEQTTFDEDTESDQNTGFDQNQGMTGSSDFESDLPEDEI